jgi:cell division control protein 6
VKFPLDDANVLDEVLEKFVSDARIFSDREVLRHDYLPDRLPHREEQIRELGETVAPVLKGSRCSNVLIYGKTGTGKTAVAKRVLSHIEFKAKEFNLPVRFCYINCQMAGSEYRVFASLCNGVGVSVPFTGLAVGEVFDRLRAGLDAAKIIFLIILDEADALVKNHGDGLLYELTRINETLSSSKVALIGISNDLRFKEFLDPRVLSSLSEEEIVFRPYDAEELRNILAERARVAFCGEALSNAALGLCAALAAAEHGDARRALDLLRVAGEVAERKGATTVGEDDVREAEKHIEHNRVVDGLQNLTLHSKLVVLGVYHVNRSIAQGSITGEIFEVYSELCGELGVPPLTQRRLSTLLNELDTMGVVNARVVSMGRYGRTKRIRLEIPRTVVKEVLSRDSRLGRLVDIEPACLHARTKKKA